MAGVTAMKPVLIQPTFFGGIAFLCFYFEIKHGKHEHMQKILRYVFHPIKNNCPHDLVCYAVTDRSLKYSCFKLNSIINY